MPVAIQFMDFTPSRKQFELTTEAEWRHAKFADSPQQHWRFMPPMKTHQLFTTFPLGEPEATKTAVVECWRESYTIPEMFGDEPISFLFVQHGEDRWAFGRNLFFRVMLEELPDELP